MIKNRAELESTVPYSGQILDLVEAGLSAALPENFVGGFLKHFGKKPVHVISYGKAAYSMAKAASVHVRVAGGIVVVPKGRTVRPLPNLSLRHAPHPIPDASSSRAARAILGYASRLGPDERLLFLISGGGSSLISLPAPPVTASDAARVSRVLIPSGADISAVNCIRRHISMVAGGRLASVVKCRAEALILSDVRGNLVRDISSGCTAPDETTFGDALGHIRRLRVEKSMPRSVMKRLADGASGLVPEGPKKTRVKNRIIATGADAARAVARAARRAGLQTRTVRVYGNVQKEAERIAGNIDRTADTCTVFYGEPTVRVTGRGRGGRNQEMALRLLLSCKRTGVRCLVASVGTDGLDGNTRYAGAVAYTGMRCAASEIGRYLENSDSSSFFSRRGGLVRTGPTQTNLADIGAVIARRAWQSRPLRG